MTKPTIALDLEAWTIQNSGLDQTRPYIPLSSLGKKDEDIIADFKNGFRGTDEPAANLRCYKGYQMEADLMRRMNIIYPGRITTTPELQLFGGRVKGHPDFYIDHILGDVKTVAMDKWLPSGRVSRRIYLQMQGYMLADKSNQSVVIFESRESGFLREFWIEANAFVQGEIERRLEDLIKELGI